MKDTGLIFTAENVRGILAGTKTQTRRIIKDAKGAFWDHRGWQPVVVDGAIIHWETTEGRARHKIGAFGPTPKCPYGKAGDRLYVRETWKLTGWQWEDVEQEIAYADGTSLWLDSTTQDDWDGDKINDWLIRETDRVLSHPSTKEMPCAPDDESRQCADSESKYVLDYTAQPWHSPIYMPRWASRITLEIAGVRVERLQSISYEDCCRETGAPLKWEGEGPEPYRRDMHGSFQILWDGINAKRGYSWDSNPWVWAIEFKRIAQ